MQETKCEGKAAKEAFQEDSQAKNKGSSKGTMNLNKSKIPIKIIILNVQFSFQSKKILPPAMLLSNGYYEKKKYSEKAM